MEVKGRLGHLSQVAQKAASHHAKGEQNVYEALASNGYGLLRETWERAVEERLLNDSVQRFRPSASALSRNSPDLLAKTDPLTFA